MKSSVHFLLVSSTLVSPLALASTEAQETPPQEQNGQISLGNKDNYEGTQASTPFPQRKSSVSIGTTYTLTTDISFANVTSTQEKTDSEEPENGNTATESGNTGESQTQDQAGTTASEIPQEQPSPEVQAESEPTAEKTEPEVKTTTEHTAEVAPDEVATTASQKSSQESQTQNEETPTSPEQLASTTNIASLFIKANTAIAETNPSSESFNPESVSTSGDTSTNGTDSSPSSPKKEGENSSNETPSSSGDKNTSCFVNTDGSLSFVGDNHSLTFSNISIAGKGSAINNSANSALTFSGFSDLSFNNATASDISTAESAIYVGLKETTSAGGSETEGTQASTGSKEAARSPAAKVATLSSEVTKESEGSEGAGSGGPAEGEGHSSGGSSGESSNLGSDSSSGSVSTGSPEESSSAPSISFHDNVNITFSGNHSKSNGGAIQVLGDCSITKNMGTVMFSNNTAQDQGGAIYSTGNVEITGNTTVVLLGNKTVKNSSPTTDSSSSTSSAPAVSAAVSTTPSPKTTDDSSATQGHGGAICCIEATTSTESTDENTPATQLRRFYANLLSQSESSTTQDATSGSSTPVVTISGNTSATFSNNSAYGYGGAIYSKFVTLSGGDITFSGNTAAQGGAIYIADGGTISISAKNGNISFGGNTQTTAIAPSITGNNNQTDSSARTTTPIHNALYLGKEAKILQLRAGTGHSLTFYDPVITQAISSGSSTNLVFNASDEPSDPSSKTIYDGRIVFSGEKLTKEEAQDSANTTSMFHSPVVLEAGTLVLKSGATLLVDSFTQNPGSLIIMDGGTTISAGFNSSSNLSPSQSGETSQKASQKASSSDPKENTETSNEKAKATSTPEEASENLINSGEENSTPLPEVTTSATPPEGESTATRPSPVPATQAQGKPFLLDNIQTISTEAKLRIHTLIEQALARSPIMSSASTGAQATPTSTYTQQVATNGSVTISNLAVNLDSLESGQVINITGTGSGKVSVTGDLQFVDSSGQFYDNPMLNSNFSTNILSITGGTGGVDTTGLNIIPQGSTTSNFGYQGQWEVVQVQGSNGQISFELKWKSQGYKPDPERRATLVPNSLWCSAIDIQAIQNLVEISSDSANSPGFWVAGISNFFHRDSTPIQQGFRHISSGYMLGTSFVTLDDYLMDVAFCQLFGRDKDYNLAHTKSHIYAATIHSKQEHMVHHYNFSKRKGAIFSQLPEQFPMIFDAHLSYSLARNAMETRHTPNPSSIGKWNNHCVATTLGCTLPRRYFSPYAQLRVVFIEQQNFKERRGENKNREFQSSHLMNVAIPLGLKFERTTAFNDLIFSLGYSPDIYRLYPKSKVFLPSGSISWATGATNLARQALLVEGSAHRNLGNSVKIFSHAAFELRGSSRNYNADLGGKYVF